MTTLAFAASFSLPRRDGSRVLFEITEGGHRMQCAISRMALEDIGERRLFSAADVLGASARMRIEGIALEKLHASLSGISGRLSLWADDVDGPLTDDVPAAAHHEAARLQSA